MEVAEQSHPDRLDPNRNSEKDLNKFTNLCSELECALANSYAALDGVLALKDLLLEQNLPSAVKVKLTLAVGRMHRSMSDLSVPSGEMTRLVRLYSVPWENKSKALKKLHQDYESKQHKLEIALRRLEMVGVQTMRMERERRIMNWEKLFAKLVGGKGHGQRWRFFIHQFKQKLKKGEDVSSFYSAVSDKDSSDDNNDDDNGNEETSKSKRNVLFAQELREKLRKFDGIGQSLAPNKVNGHDEVIVGRNSIIEEESEASIILGASDDNASTIGAEIDTPLSATKKKVRFDDADSVHETEQEKGRVQIMITANTKKCVADKECWTHEPDFENLFHVRIFPPKCKTLTSSWCTLLFDNEIRKSQVFKEVKQERKGAGEKQPPTDEKMPSAMDDLKQATSKEERVQEENNGAVLSDTRVEIEDYQEFGFKLSKDFDNQDKTEVLLKFSIHPANKKKMIAMTTIKLSDIVIADEKSISSSKVKPTSYQIKSAVNNAELIFNRPCGEIRILCYYSKVILPLSISRGTETLSIEELTNRIIELRKKDFVKRLKSAGTSMTEKPIYTEEQMSNAKEELKQQLRALREEYEERLSLLISHLSKENLEDLREFVNTATSPMFMWSESSNTQEVEEESILRGKSNDIFKPYKVKSSKKVTSQKTEKKQKIWGQNLPDDFYERMEMFKEESFKHHQKLKDKIKDEVGKEIERTLASNNKLDVSSSREGRIPEEICLPALYMPTKTRNLYTPKARSYFHAFGTYRDRLTQAPSILELPRLRNDNADIVGIYEAVMQQKMDKGMGKENDDTDLGRFSPESSTSIEITGLDNAENEDQTETNENT